MLTPSPTWIVRGSTFALWALAAGSAAFWAFRMSGGSQSLSAPPAPPRQVAQADAATLARVLGGSPAAVGAPAPVAALSSRMKLLGVAAGAHSGQGAAVISVDGKPPRSYRVGSTIEEGYVLQSVRGRQAVIASQPGGQPVATLETPRLRLDLTQPAPAAPPAAAGVPQGSAPDQQPEQAAVAPQLAPEVQQLPPQASQLPAEASQLPPKGSRLPRQAPIPAPR